jgi:DNA-directed RNA polymerase subunit RPC12/RpoP
MPPTNYKFYCNECGAHFVDLPEDRDQFQPIVCPDCDCSDITTEFDPPEDKETPEPEPAREYEPVPREAFDFDESTVRYIKDEDVTTTA